MRAGSPGSAHCDLALAVGLVYHCNVAPAVEVLLLRPGSAHGDLVGGEKEGGPDRSGGENCQMTKGLKKKRNTALHLHVYFAAKGRGNAQHIVCIVARR